MNAFIISNHCGPIWIYPKENAALKESIVKESKIHPVTAQVLISRGFESLESVHDFLYSRLPNLHDTLYSARNAKGDRQNFNGFGP